MPTRVALITGAGRGIGRAVALETAARGYALALAARTPEGIEETARRAGEAGAPEVSVLAGDLTRASFLDALVDEIAGRWGRLDVLVQNAGRFAVEPLESATDEEWDRVIALNLTAPFRLLRRCLDLLRRAGGGHVFHIVSVAGRRPFAGCSAYCASKHGLMGLTGVAREELRGSGTRVTAILPGAVDTPSWDEVGGDLDRARMLKPEDVARAVAAALGDREGAMTEEIVLRPQAGDL